jgi:2-C-methyl-D-erythritol 4-phosphate cytidylyltransferase/2-C-methyl-D-erythritol 2,4-cyclodiphosphate synthase
MVLPPVKGGASRQESCRAGVEAAAAHEPDLVLIHDAARPFVSPQVIERVISRLRSADAVVPALAVPDTIKRANDGLISETLQRSGLFTIQTPQGFRFDKIRAAHDAAMQSGRRDLTDDASVAEAFGLQVHIVEGDAFNRKLTTSADILNAQASFNQGLPNVRVGQGIDFHVFERGKSVWLCGVEVPHTHGLKGHSDADVALHALTDALLGAIGEGDIGTHFPPSDPQWKGARSEVFVSKAVALIAARGGLISNVDITILAEAPRISPHLAAMKEEVARQLGISATQIAIKATTTEKMGAIGRKEGMAAQATACLRLP